MVSVPDDSFAMNEAKALFAHIVTTYDVKFEEGVRRDSRIAGHCRWSALSREFECDVQGTGRTAEVKLLWIWQSDT